MRLSLLAAAALALAGCARVARTTDVPACPGVFITPVERPRWAFAADLDGDGDGDLLLFDVRAGSPSLVVLRAADPTGEAYCQAETHPLAPDPAQLPAWAVAAIPDLDVLVRRTPYPPPWLPQTDRERRDSFTLDPRRRLYASSPDHWIAAEGDPPPPTGRRRVRPPFRPDWAAYIDPTGHDTYGLRTLYIGAGARIAVSLERHAKSRWRVLRLPRR